MESTNLLSSFSRSETRGIRRYQCEEGMRFPPRLPDFTLKCHGRRLTKALKEATINDLRAVSFLPDKSKNQVGLFYHSRPYSFVFYLKKLAIEFLRSKKVKSTFYSRVRWKKKHLPTICSDRFPFFYFLLTHRATFRRDRSRK